MKPKAQAKKKKLDFINIKNIYPLKNIINNVEMQHVEWEKIFAKHISGKVLIPKIYKELLKFNTKIAHFKNEQS